MQAMTTLEFPRELLQATRMSEAELKTELSLTLFVQGKLSFGKAREMAGMDVWTFQQLLGSRSISLHYDLDEYEEDLETLRNLGIL
jgi:predicted HTH domain antitoxin